MTSTYAPVTSAKNLSNKGASPKQIELIRKLMAEREVAEKPGYEWHRMSMAAASDAITALFKMDIPGQPTEIGFYALNGEVYKLKPNQSGTKLWAHRLLEAVPGHKPKWEYVGGPAKIKGAVKLAVAEAEKFGKITGYCMCCGRLLTNEKSVKLGIGPFCRGEYFS